MAENKVNIDLNLQKNKLIDPRLNPKTSAQIAAMTPTSSDESLIVWDSDKNAFFVWDAPTLTWIPLMNQVFIQSDSLTFPSAINSDELIVTSDGTATGFILEEWIFDGVNWIKRPTRPLYIPTPKVFIPTNGWQNQNSGQEPSNILSLDPKYQNRELFIKLYYDGNDKVNDWMNLPELKYELIRLKNYQSKGTQNTSFQKKRTGHVWVHPSHEEGTARNGTNYSGGLQRDISGNTLIRQTEWNVNTQSNKGASQLVGNNPYTEIQIDPMMWFYNPQLGTTSYGTDILPKTKIDYVLSEIRVSGFKGRTTSHGIQTFKFAFRMSAADPTSWNAAKNRFDKRIYSEVSEMFEIYPHGGNFEYGGVGGSGVIEHVLYEWRIKPL